MAKWENVSGDRRNYLFGSAIDYVGRKLGNPFKDYGISEKLMGLASPIGVASASESDDSADIGKMTGSPYVNSPTDNLQQNSGGGAGDGGSTFDQWFNGVHYTDPISYANAVNAAAVEAYNAANKSLQDAYTKGLIDIATYETQLRQNRENIQTQYKDAMGVVSGRFAAQGPNVYQSEQGKKEGRIGDITNQNYENQAMAEANLGLQKTGFENEYANLQEQNRNNQQNVIDATMNELSDKLAGTPFANQLSQVQAPTINNLPLDNSFMNTYNQLGGMKGNTPAIKSAIGASNQPTNIKDWLYSRFANQTTV